MTVLERTVFDPEGEAWELPVESWFSRASRIQTATGLVQLGMQPGGILYGACSEKQLRWHAALVASLALGDDAKERGLAPFDLARRFAEGEVDFVDVLQASVYDPTAEDRSFSLLGRTFTFPKIPLELFEDRLRIATFLVQSNGWKFSPDYLAYWLFLLDDLNTAGIRAGDFMLALRERTAAGDHSAMRAALFATGRIASAEEFDSISAAASAHLASLPAPAGEESKEQASNDDAAE